MSQRLKYHRRGSTSEDYADIEKVRGSSFRGVCKRNEEARSIFEESLLSDLHNSLYLPVHALSSVNSVHTVIRSFATTSCTGRAGIRVGLDLPRSRDVRARAPLLLLSPNATTCCSSRRMTPFFSHSYRPIIVKRNVSQRFPMHDSLFLRYSNKILSSLLFLIITKHFLIWNRLLIISRQKLPGHF